MGRVVTRRYEYNGDSLSMADILDLPECTKSRNTIRNGLEAGKSVAELLMKDKPKKDKPHKNSSWHMYKGRLITISEYMEISNNPLRRCTLIKKISHGATLDSIEADYIAALPKVVNREKIKAIMSVPINPRATQIFYTKRQPLRNDGNPEPFSMKQNGFMDI